MSQQHNENVDMDEIIVGRNAVVEAIHSGRDIEYVMVAKGAGGSALKIIAECKERKVPIKFLPHDSFNLRFQGVNHQSVAAVVSSATYCEVEDILEAAKANDKKALILILDEIEDPHNLGAIIRTAEAAGVDGIIIPKRRSAGLNQTVAKVASGALEYMPVARVTNISVTIDKLKQQGIWVYGAHMEGDDVFATDLTDHCAIVIGSEGKGISRLVKEKCDFLIKIPMLGKINSLNASVAAGIIMYQAVKSRKMKGSI